MVGRLAVALALVTIAALDVIIVIGAGLPASPTGERLTAMLVPIMDLSLLASSLLLGRMLIARGLRWLGLLFLLNLVLFAIAAVIRASGTIPPRWALYGVDVYWLNLYLITLAGYWPLHSE